MDPQQTPSQHGGMARPVALLALLLCCASTAAAWVVPALACARGGAAQRSGVLRLRANRAAPRARPPERNRAVLRLARRTLTLRAHDCASLFHSLVGAAAVTTSIGSYMMDPHHAVTAWIGTAIGSCLSCARAIGFAGVVA